MYKTLGLSNGNSQASTSTANNSTSTQRNQPMSSSSNSSPARLLWASFRVWHLNEKLSFDEQSDRICEQKKQLWTLSGGSESPEELQRDMKILRDDRRQALAQKALDKWNQELAQNKLTWDSWTDMTPEERADVDETFKLADRKGTIEHSLLQAPTPLPATSALSSPLGLMSPHARVDPATFSDIDDDDGPTDYVNIKNFTSDSEVVTWNAETPQSSSHNPSPRMSPRHMSLHSSFESIHAPVAQVAESALVIRKPGSAYIGPELISSPPPSHTSSPMEEEEEEEFELFRANVRAMKIREFHTEAAEADIQLASEMHKAQKHNLLSPEEMDSHIRMHDKRMVLLRKTKDEERKKIVAAEREKRRARLRQEQADIQGGLVVRRPRKNTITGYMSPVLNSASGASSKRPSAESSPEGLFSSALMRLGHSSSPLDTPVANFNDPPSWSAPYHPSGFDLLQSPQSIAYQTLSPSKLFSPQQLAAEPLFPGSFETKGQAPRHEQQGSMSSSNSDNNSLWSHVGSPTRRGDTTAASSPPSERGSLSSPQKTSSALAQSTASLASTVAPQITSSASKSSSTTPSAQHTDPATAKAALARSTVAHSASQKAGVPAPQPLSAQPTPIKSPAPMPAKKPTAQPMVRKVQPTVKAPPPPQPMQSKYSSAQQYQPKALQAPVPSHGLPVAPSRQISTASASKQHERWLPPTAGGPAPAQIAPPPPPPPPPPPAPPVSAKSAGKKPEVARREPEPAPAIAASRSPPPLLRPANNPPRVDGAGHSAASASSSRIEPSASTGWSSTGWTAPAIAPSMSSSTSSMSASQQSHQIWRPAEKPKVEEKRKAIEAKQPEPILKPSVPSSSSSSKPTTSSSSANKQSSSSQPSSSAQQASSSQPTKKSKKSKSKPSVEIEEIPDEEEIKQSRGDALPQDSRYLLEPSGSSKSDSKGKSVAKDAKASTSTSSSSKAHAKASPFERIQASDFDDASSDGTVRVGKGKERKGSIPTDWSTSTVGGDAKHARWASNVPASSSSSAQHHSMVPASSFGGGKSSTVPANGFSAADYGDERMWHNATQEVFRPSEKSSRKPMNAASSSSKKGGDDLQTLASAALSGLRR